jgi:hypothetical protein
LHRLHRRALELAELLVQCAKSVAKRGTLRALILERLARLRHMRSVPHLGHVAEVAPELDAHALCIPCSPPLAGQLVPQLRVLQEQPPGRCLFRVQPRLQRSTPLLLAGERGAGRALLARRANGRLRGSLASSEERAETLLGLALREC